MDYLESKYGQYFIKIPIALFVIGFFIHNLYLSRFSESEFEILQSKYIYVGSIAVAVITIILFFVIIRLDFDEPGNNLKIRNLSMWFIRVPILAIILHTFLFPQSNIIAGPISNYFNRTCQLLFTTIYRILSFHFLLGILWMSYGVVWDKDKKIILFFKRLYLILFIPTFIILLTASSLNSDFFQILLFVFYFFMLVLFYLANESDTKKGITTKASVLKNENSPFSKSLAKYLSLIYGLFSLTMVIVLYTISLYPLLPQSFGGARPRDVILFTTSDTLKVKLINESTSWFLFKKPDSTIVKIKSSSVNKVQLVK